MENEFNFIKKNLITVKKNIEDACIRSGRNVDDVTLVCVSKTKPIEMIQIAKDLGESIFGENRVQEILKKYNKVNNIKFHMIGHLQTNKVKDIIDKVEIIHSVDSLKLAKEIQKQAEKIHKVMDILVEVNVAKEISKFGVMEEDIYDLILPISKMKNICLKGLMTIPPNDINPENNRKYFRKLKQIIIDINNKKIDNIKMNILSMGMSNDYKIAIEEGSTFVRIGSKIFGNRK